MRSKQDALCIVCTTVLKWFLADKQFIFDICNTESSKWMSHGDTTKCGIAEQFKMTHFSGLSDNSGQQIVCLHKSCFSDQCVVTTCLRPPKPSKQQLQRDANRFALLFFKVQLLHETQHFVLLEMFLAIIEHSSSVDDYIINI